MGYSLIAGKEQTGSTHRILMGNPIGNVHFEPRKEDGIVKYSVS
jgi:hypothetical protein